jgi:hypothetical protein
MYPTIEQLRVEGYVVYMLDIDANPNSSVSLLPTTVIMNKGVEVRRFRGITSKTAIAAMLQR